MPKMRTEKGNLWKCGVKCKFCKKVLTKEKEVVLRKFVCEKVPQEVFQPRAPFGGSSVSLGTTSNSSLTNPLFGAPVDK